MELKRVSVTEKALAQRINKNLKSGYQQLHKSRSNVQRLNLGTWYITNLEGVVEVWNVEDLESLGRDVGCLSTLEYLAD